MDSQNTLPIKKLLVAEDNESNFLLVMTILKRDYQIIHAHDGIEAIQLFKNTGSTARTPSLWILKCQTWMDWKPLVKSGN